MALIVITADRSLMSEYRKNIFFGFTTSAPRGFVPDWFFYRFACKQVKVGPGGEAFVAPYAVRKLEAILLASGFDRSDVVVAHPDHIEECVSDDTRVIAISVMDPLGIGPVTSGLVGLFGGEPYTAQSFRRLMKGVSRARQGRDIRVVVGGPGTWQLASRNSQDLFGIDTLVYGEAESVAPALFKAATNGLRLPRCVEGKPVPIEDSPDIVAPSICGLIEISRGCGRGCSFCAPGRMKLRSKPLRHILAEAKTNIRFGETNVILHGEDVFRYGAKAIQPNRDAVVRLFEAVSQLEGLRTLNVSHGAFSSILAEPSLLPAISEILGLDENHWKAYEVGLETGSTRLVKTHMTGKCKPFRPEDWPEVVEQATAISNDAHWLPVATLIMGLPGETGDDVAKTLELVDDLADYWIMLYPLFFVPLGATVGEEFFANGRMLQEHWELFLRCWEINLKQYKKTFADILPYTNYSYWEKLVMRTFLNVSVRRGLDGIRRARRALREGRPFRFGHNLYRYPRSSLHDQSALKSGH